MAARRVLTSVAYSAGVAVVLILVLGKPGGVTPTFLWREVLNTGHVPLFGLIALALLGLSASLFGAEIPRWRHYLIALGGSVVLGGASELLQIHIARDPELGDYLRDIAGAVAALASVAAFDRRIGADRRDVRRALLALALAVLLAGLLPLAVWLEAYRQRTRRFPYLARFDSALELLFVRTWKAEIELTDPPRAWDEKGGRRVARIVYAPFKYPSMKLHEPYANWEGYRFLDLDLFLDGTREAAVVVRIDDLYQNNDYGDRYNRKFDLQPGSNHIRIPLSEVRDGPKTRRMDMTEIAAFLLFAVKPEQPVVLYLADLKLSTD